MTDTPSCILQVLALLTVLADYGGAEIAEVLGLSDNPAMWLLERSSFIGDFIWVRAGETLPLAEGDDALLDASGFVLSFNPDGSVRIAIPRTTSRTMFYRIDM